MGPCASMPSSFDSYRVALETMRYEGNLLWQIFVAFLIIHTVFISFLFQSLLVLSAYGFYPGRFFAAVGGLALCVPWCASYSRNAAHYRYHLAKVRLAEQEGWHLYSGCGREFSAGKRVQVGSEVHQLGWLACRVKSGRMIPPVIVTFVVFYCVILLYTGLWRAVVSLGRILFC